MNQDNKEELVAPCGMYCGICDRYLALSHQIPKRRGRIYHCTGCRPRKKDCSFIKKKCKTGKIYEVNFCYECEAFPCEVLERGSKGYKRYNYSFIEKLYQIQEKGLDWFIEEQERIYQCERCGDTLCVHNGKCYSCDREQLTE